MDNDKSVVVSFRIPADILAKVDSYVENSPIKITRSAALVYLISFGLSADKPCP